MNPHATHLARYLLLWGLSASVVLVPESLFASPRPHAVRVSTNPALSYFEGIPQRGSALGAENATLTLTDFSDLQCPFCRNFPVQVLPTLVTRYVRSGRLRVVFANFPILGPDSDRAARFAVAAGMQNRMWQFVDVFMRNQQREGSGYVTEGYLRKIAQEVPGLDAMQATADADSADVSTRLAEVSQQAGSQGIRATPTFLLGRTGGRPTQLHVSSSNPDAFVEAIERALTEH